MEVGSGGDRGYEACDGGLRECGGYERSLSERFRG